jgi:hypothetical protein
MNYETTDDVMIRQNAAMIRHLETIKGLLVGILLVLIVPIVIVLISMLASS